jgi:adenosylcobinamide-GDP ribazoletransferase
LILAVRFLTIVPLPGRERADRSALGRAAWWFPVVGLMLGVVLVVADRVVLALAPPLVGAALLVAVWKIMTGGIHLDGLADCLDGLAGPDEARRRAIMRDSRIGVFGAAGLGLALILFVTSLSELPAPIRSRVLLLAPVLGRVSPLLAAAWLRPATPGQDWAARLPPIYRAGPVRCTRRLAWPRRPGSWGRGAPPSRPERSAWLCWGRDSPPATSPGSPATCWERSWR